MSAFVVDKAHIEAMLRAAMAYGHDRGSFTWAYDSPIGRLDYANADQVGQMLLAECVASVSYRYPADTLVRAKYGRRLRTWAGYVRAGVGEEIRDLPSWVSDWIGDFDHERLVEPIEFDL